MWQAIRLSAARQLRVDGAISTNSAARLASRVAGGRAPFSIPNSYRVQLSVRGFAEARGRPPKTGTAAKAARKTKAGTKESTKKAAAKKKAAVAKKKKAAAPKKKPKTRKVLSPEEKKRVEVRELRKAALLQEPRRLPNNAWTVYITEHTKGHKTGAGSSIGAASKQLSESFRSLSLSETERLSSVASQNRLANDAAYKAWVEGHNPAVIAEANKARSRLRRTLKVKVKSPIKDDRLPKRPVSGYMMFTKSRWASGEFQGRRPAEAGKSIAAEWKALSASDRQPYMDSAKADADRYEKQTKSILHR